MAAPLRFYFDFISPYAYLSWAALQPLAQRTGRVLEPIPTLFAGLLNHHGQLGPAEVPPKRQYIFRDVVRKAHLAGLTECLPLRPPRTHPFRPLLPLRVSSNPTITPEQRRRVITAIFRATWSEERPIEQPADLIDILAGAVPDVSADKLVAEAHTDAAKERLREATAAAVAVGVFGVPTVVVDQELFWGFDATPALEAYVLTGRDPASMQGDHAAAILAWDQIRSSAQRRPGLGPRLASARDA